MSRERESRLAAALLRLLLGRSGAEEFGDERDWAVVARIGAENAVLVRCTERLQAAGVHPPACVTDAAARLAARARAMLDAAAAVGDLCRSRGIPFIYPKLLQHVPDMGRDLDLLVLPRSAELDGHLRRALGAVPLPTGLRERITGAASYRIPGCPAVLDVLHGRLGVLGEQTGFPATLLRRSRPVATGGKFDVPSPEDQLVLQGMQRVYGRTGIRLGEVVATVRLLRHETLDWDYVMATARETAIHSGLACYLSYVGQIHAEAVGEPLPCPPAARSLMRGHWGRVHFRGGGYRFPAAAVNCRLYLRRLADGLASGRWAELGRLGLMPAVAAATLHGRALRRLRQGPPSGEVLETVGLGGSAT